MIVALRCRCQRPLPARSAARRRLGELQRPRDRRRWAARSLPFQNLSSHCSTSEHAPFMVLGTPTNDVCNGDQHTARLLTGSTANNCTTIRMPSVRHAHLSPYVSSCWPAGACHGAGVKGVFGAIGTFNGLPLSLAAGVAATSGRQRHFANALRVSFLWHAGYMSFST